MHSHHGVIDGIVSYATSGLTINYNGTPLESTGIVSNLK